MAPHKPPRSELIEAPGRFVDLAKRRTEFLFSHLTYGDMSLRLALACAYTQGLSDAAEITLNPTPARAEQQPEG